MKKILTLLLAAITTTSFAQKTKIQLNLQKDSTYYLDQKSTLTITQDIPGHKQVVATVLNGRVAHKVISITDTSYVLAVRFESLVMQARLGDNMLMDVNTADKSKQDAMSKVMQSMLGRSITMVITKMGKVLEIRGVDELYNHAFDNFPELDEDKKEQVLSRVKQSFGEKAFRSSFQDAFAVFPADPVSVNDTWQASTVMESAAQAKINTTYLLKNITDNAYVIHGDAQVTPSGNGDYVMTTMPMRYINLTGSFSADIIIDRSTGWIKEEKVAKLVNGDLDIKDNPQVPGGIKFPMSVDAEISVTNK